jgi:hypothetical protein
MQGFQHGMTCPTRTIYEQANRQTVRTMKLVTLFLTVACLQANAAGNPAQKITLNEMGIIEFLHWFVIVRIFFFGLFYRALISRHSRAVTWKLLFRLMNFMHDIECVIRLMEIQPVLNGRVKRFILQKLRNLLTEMEAVKEFTGTSTYKTLSLTRFMFKRLFTGVEIYCVLQWLHIL